MRKDIQMIRLLMLMLTLTFGMTSCSEDDDTQEEFVDWVDKNDEYFLNLYDNARLNTDGTWKVISKFSLNDSVAALSPTSHIVVKVIENGTGSACPIYTDSVKVHYRGRLIPSPSYPEGYVFDQSYRGEYVPDLITPSKFAVSAVVDGFSTALQHMRIGDRWLVYIPYQLGYGASDYTASSSSGTIPGGSTLIFDLTLVSFHHPGDTDTRAIGGGYWVEK